MYKVFLQQDNLFWMEYMYPAEYYCCHRLRSGATPGSTKYEYEDFYKAAATAGGGEADAFLCIENDLVYVPHLNELMLYKGKNGSAYQYKEATA